METLVSYEFVQILADISGLAMVISLLEIQRNEPVYWRVRKCGGACTLLDFGWQERGSIASFSLDSGSATRIVGNVPTFMTHPKLPFVRSF